VQVAPAELTILVAYPAVFQLQASGWGGTNADGSLVLPATVPASVRFLDPQGAYLVDAGYVCFLWIGASAPLALIQVRSYHHVKIIHTQSELAEVAYIKVQPCVTHVQVGHVYVWHVYKAQSFETIHGSDEEPQGGA
jgi:hypothetical protein